MIEFTDWHKRTHRLENKMGGGGGGIQRRVGQVVEARYDPTSQHGLNVRISRTKGSPSSPWLSVRSCCSSSSDWFARHFVCRQKPKGEAAHP